VSDVPEAVAVVGMAGRWPQASDLEELWANLCAGRDCISFFTDEELAAEGFDRATLARPGFVKAHGALDGVELFDADFFHLTPREAEVLDPQKRLLLECAWQAIEHAGFDPARPPGPVGLFAGVSSSTYLFNNLLANPAAAAAAGYDQLALGSEKDFLTTLISYKLDLRGPSVTVQTACSTSLVAVHLACQSLLGYQCDLALAGGVSVKVPQRSGYLYQQGGILSPDGHCRAFDARAAGTVTGSGAGMVVLRRLEDALAGGDRIWAVVRGSAMNNDGALKAGYSAPSVDGQSRVIATALALAEVEAESLSYVEAHGSGTPLGDPIEVAALDRVFRRRTARRGFCALGSVKTNLGHLDAAAGITGFLKTVLALAHRQIPPSLHFTEPNPQIDFAGSAFYVNTALAEWNPPGPRRAGVSSFGIGGTNVHVVLEEAPAVEPSTPTEGWQLLLLAARTESALESATDRLAAHLRAHPELEIADVAYTLQTGRRGFACRRAVLCRSHEEAAAALELRTPRQVWSGRTGAAGAANAPSSGARPVTFLFPGLGDHYAGMARGLYTANPTFRRELDRCLEIAHGLGLDLRGALFPEGSEGSEGEDAATAGSAASAEKGSLRRMLGRGEGGEGEAGTPDPLERTSLAQPAVFAVEVALARTLLGLGVKPESMIGYSLGDYTAACLAGVFSLEDALRIVVLRARWIEELPAGGMLAVPLSAEAVAPFLHGGLCLAAVNGPQVSVVAGPAAEVDALAERLAQGGLAARRLRTAHAFHSGMMEPVRERLVQLLAGMRLQAPEVPFVTNVTGTWIRPEEAVDPAFWGRHLAETVRFADGVAELMRDPARVFLEVGPGASLSSLLLQHPGAGPGRVAVPLLRNAWDRQPDAAFLLAGLGKLWLAGVEIDGAALHAGERRRRVPLPTYPFERRRYWIDPAPAAAGRPPVAGKNPDLAAWFYAPVWRESVLPPSTAQASAARAEDAAGWLLFVDRRGVGSALAGSLGGRVVTVEAGDSFARLAALRYRIAPGRPDDYLALLDDLAARGGLPHRIVHLWSVGAPAEGDPAVAVERCQEVGFLSLLFLAQALGARQIPEPLELTAVADGLHAVLGGEALQPGKATLIGPCLVLPRELHGVSCRCVDLDLAAGSPGEIERAATALRRELSLPPAERIVAWRGLRRWLQDFQPLRLEGGPDGGLPRPRRGGTWLITGGTGGIGLELAAFLAREAGARLALLGRSGLPPREAWDGWLATHGPADRTSRRIARVREIEALGGEVLVLAGDVTDRARMTAVLHEVHERFGPIHGAIHAAGTAAGGLLALRTAAGALETLAPKVTGTLLLADLLRGEPLDVLVLCSSLSSILGGLGQADYCAANAFLDAFARRATASGGPPTVAIGWDTWREVGMAVEAEASEEVRRLREEHLHAAIDPAEGTEVFRRILAHPLPWIAVSTQHLPALVAWAHRLEGVEEELRAAAAPVAPHARPGLAAPYAAPRNELEEGLAAIWRQVLGLAEVGIHDPFPELGGHSLLAMRVGALVQTQFGVHLSLRTLFEAPTIAELAVVVLGETASQTDGEDLAGLLSSLEGLSDTEAEALLSGLSGEIHPTLMDEPDGLTLAPEIRARLAAAAGSGRIGGDR
jgi:acyl transferase domain-containing protein